VSQVRVHNFSVSLDGFGTGEGQSLDAPFGHAGTRLHEWFFPTRTFRAMQGEPGGSTGIDDGFASAWGTGVGAEIMGRGKFGPHRGPWPDQEWNGWWGDNPPFHTPVFVLTHHLRPAVQMTGGTTFHFLDASPAQALVQARQAAAGRDIRIGGGPSTYLYRRGDRKWFRGAVGHDLGRALLCSLAMIAAGSCERAAGSGGAERPRSGAAGALDAAARERIIGGRGQGSEPGVGVSGLARAFLVADGGDLLDDGTGGWRGAARLT